MAETKPRSPHWFAAYTLAAFLALGTTTVGFHALDTFLKSNLTLMLGLGTTKGQIAWAILTNMAAGIIAGNIAETRRKARNLTRRETLENTGWSIAALAFAIAAWAIVAITALTGNIMHAGLIVPILAAVIFISQMTDKRKASDKATKTEGNAPFKEKLLRHEDRS